jgi:hypothetical protein
MLRAELNAVQRCIAMFETGWEEASYLSQNSDQATGKKYVGSLFESMQGKKILF